MMFSGFWNSWSTYCFRFLLNFFYSSLASLFLDVVPKNVPKPSTSTLKLIIYGVYDGWLKCPLHLSHPWWPPLPPQPPRHCPQPPFSWNWFSHDLCPWVVVESPPLPLLPADGEAVSVSGVVTFFSNFFWITLFSLFCMRHNPMCS